MQSNLLPDYQAFTIKRKFTIKAFTIKRKMPPLTSPLTEDALVCEYVSYIAKGKIRLQVELGC